MSVWPETAPGPLPLTTSEGTLVSISISVDARRLEWLLEALARISFPINPQIYHDAAVVYRHPDGHEETEPATLVEFPAYECRLDEVSRALEAYGFDAHSVQVTPMLDDISAAAAPERVRRGAAVVSRYHVKHRAAAAVQ
jgi:hypothetical protein